MENDSATPSKHLRRAVERTRKTPFFMGWALAVYEKLHNLEKRQIAERLQCAPEALDRLALCRRPLDTEPEFQAHLRRIADFVSCDADRLVQVLREVAAFASLRETTDAPENSFLLAARDRKEDRQKNGNSSGSKQENEP